MSEVELQDKTQVEIVPDTTSTGDVVIEIKEETTNLIPETPSEVIPDDIANLDERGLGEDLLFNTNKVTVSPDEINKEAVVAVAASAGGISAGVIIAIVVIIVLGLGLGLGLSAGVGIGLGIGLNSCSKPSITKSEFLPSTPFCLDVNARSFEDGILGNTFNIYKKDDITTYPSFKVFRDGNFLRDVNITDAVTAFCPSQCTKLNYTYTPNFFSFESKDYSKVRYEVTNFQNCIAPLSSSYDFLAYRPTISNYTEFCISTTPGDPFFTAQTNISGSGFYQKTGDTTSRGSFTVGGFPYSIVAQHECTKDGDYEFCKKITVSLSGSTFVPYTFLNYKINYGSSSCQSNATLWAPSYPVITAKNSRPICFGANAIDVDITGSGFYPNTSLYLSGTTSVTNPSSSRYIDTTSMRVSFPNLPPGDYAFGGKNLGCSRTYPSVTLTYLPRSQVIHVEPNIFHPELTQKVEIFLSGSQYVGVNVIISASSGTQFQLQNFASINENFVSATVQSGITSGTYTVSVSNTNFCTSQSTGTSNSLITVATPNGASIVVSPRTVLQDRSTQVTITSNIAFFSANPIVYLKKPSDTTPIPLNGAEFNTTTTIIAFAPAGLDVGSYDVIVITREGLTSKLSSGFTVTSTPFPTIASVSPVTFIQGSTTSAIINGTGFSSPLVSLDCINLDTPTSTLTNLTASSISFSSSTSIIFTIPSISFTRAACTVNVVNLNNFAFVSFTGITYRGTGASGVAADLATNLPISVYDHGIAVATETNTNYVVLTGGLTGATFPSTTYSQNVYFSQLDRYGRLSGSSWTQTNSLPTGIAGHCSFAVGSTVYVIGGRTSVQAQNQIYSSTFMDSQIYPSITSMTQLYVGTGQTLPAGYFYYRISANLNQTDSLFPGEETYSGDVYRVGFGTSGYTVTLTWETIPGAVSYNIYRSSVNQPSSSVRLMRTVTTNTYTDTNADANTGKSPVSSVVMSTWRLVGNFNAKRSNFACNTAASYTTSNLNYIYILGGLDTGLLDSIEYGGVLVTPKPSLKSRGSQSVLSFNTTTEKLNNAKDAISSVILSNSDYGLIPTNEYYIYVGGGDATNYRQETIRINNLGVPTIASVAQNAIDRIEGYCMYKWKSPSSIYSFIGGKNNNALSSSSVDFSLSTLTTWTQPTSRLSYNAAYAFSQCTTQNGLFYAYGGVEKPSNTFLITNKIRWNVL